jgi:hypothetical protein
VIDYTDYADYTDWITRITGGDVEKKRQPGEDMKPLPNEEVISPGGEQGEQSGTADDHSERPMKPRKDHGERRGGGDQDIDTAGMVPGNKATKNTDATGF